MGNPIQNAIGAIKNGVGRAGKFAQDVGQGVSNLENKAFGVKPTPRLNPDMVKKAGYTSIDNGPYKSETISKLPSYKKGGKIKKTGPALVHKGEYVLNKGKAEALEKKMDIDGKGHVCKYKGGKCTCGKMEKEYAEKK